MAATLKDTDAHGGSMDDLTATRLCAEACDREFYEQDGKLLLIDQGGGMDRYDPLHDDAQAMALVKRFDLHIGKTLRTPEHPRGMWFVSRTDKHEATSGDLNRAIVMCVAAIRDNNKDNK